MQPVGGLVFWESTVSERLSLLAFIGYTLSTQATRLKSPDQSFTGFSFCGPEDEPEMRFVCVCVCLVV